MVTRTVGNRIAGALSAGVLLLLTAACAQRPAGALTDDWPDMPEPAAQVPTAGTCYHVNAASYAERILYTGMRAMPTCDARHKSETIYVGQFEGEHARRASPPPDGGPGARQAYQRCADAASEFLGGEWHTARVWLSVFVPSSAAWDSGARWFRCDLMEVDSAHNVIEDRTASMRDGLRGARPLALTCAVDTGGIGMYYESCAQRHNAEFVGVYVPTAADLATRQDDLDDRLYVGCWNLAAAYLGLPLSRVPKGLVALVRNIDQDRERGEFSVRCFVALANRDQTIMDGATLKGLGSRPLPTGTG